MSVLRLSICLLALLISNEISAMRSDSFSISKSVIRLSIRNFSAKTISGSTQHHLRLKVKTNQVSFDLKQLSLDSVKMGGQKLFSTRLSERIQIALGQTFQANDTLALDSK